MIDDDDYLYHINICMVYEQRIWVALFYTSISYLRVLTINHNHILFLPVILSSKYNKQKIKIKSVSLNVATYSVQLVLLCLRGNPTFTYYAKILPILHYCEMVQSHDQMVRIRQYHLIFHVLFPLQKIQTLT